MTNSTTAAQTPSRWTVDVRNLPSDIRLLQEVLAVFSLSLDASIEPPTLFGPPLESLDSAGPVRDHVEKVMHAIALASPLYAANLEVGDRVLERREDGTVGRHHFATCHAAGHATATAVGTITANAAISAEARQAAIAAQREKEHQITVARVRARALAASRKAEAAKVLELLNGELSVTSMNAIGEIIQADVGKLGALGMQNQFDRFNRSICHPETFGADARHAVARGEAHPDPMTREECQAFIRELADRWFSRLTT